MVFETQHRNPDLDLKIVPIGLNYNDHLAFQTELLVVFGDPIRVKPYYEKYLENKTTGYTLLLEELAVRMKDIIVHIPNDKRYPEIEKRWLENRVISRNLMRDLRENQKLVTQLLEDPNFSRSDEISFQRRRQTQYKIVRRIVLFPIWIYGWLNNLIGIGLIHRALKKVKDVHFTSSFKFLLGMFLMPAVYLLQAFLVGIFTNWQMGMVYFFTLPVFSWIYFRWLR
jgi:1-acyl-sn-glycerol-3-phosphate acyltransferase